jgi:hypothetical protein
MAERGERATGTPNTIYDLASVLYHTLEAGASYDQYLRDAEEAGDQELVEFFRVLRDEDRRRSDYAQELLAQRTPTAARMGDTATSREEVAPGVSPRTESASAPPPGIEDVPPARTEEARPTVRPMRPAPEGTVPPSREEEAPPTGQEERTARPVREREEDRGFLDEVRDRLLGPPEERRSEGTDRPDRR